MRSQYTRSYEMPLKKEWNHNETLARPSHFIKTPGSNYPAVLTAARAISYRVVGTSVMSRSAVPWKTIPKSPGMSKTRLRSWRRRASLALSMPHYKLDNDKRQDVGDLQETPGSVVPPWSCCHLQTHLERRNRQNGTSLEPCCFQGWNYRPSHRRGESRRSRGGEGGWNRRLELFLQWSRRSKSQKPN